jgi:hypothetical protein
MLGLALGASGFSTVGAAESDEAPSAVVGYSDLQPSASDGQRQRLTASTHGDDCPLERGGRYDAAARTGARPEHVQDAYFGY